MKNFPIAQSITNRDVDSLDRYFRDIRKYKPLSPEMERHLGELALQGNQLAKDKLVLHNLSFVVSIAKQYQGQGLPLADLISEGTAGAVRASNHFDPNRDVKFISYAVWWIRQAILEALSYKSRTVRIPVSKLITINKINKITDSFIKEYEREPSYSELADLTGLPIEKIIDSLNSKSQRSISLDNEVADGINIIDTISDDSENDNYMSDLKNHIVSFLDILSVREKAVIQLSFGIGTNEVDLDVIGKMFNVTPERIRQIREEALNKLRKKCYSS